MPRRFGPLIGVLALFVFPGCQTGLQSAKHPAEASPQGPITPSRVGDKDFGRSAYRLLLDSQHDKARLALLVGVVRHQLLRARRRFDGGHRRAGFDAVLGGPSIAAGWRIQARDHHWTSGRAC